MAAEKRSQSGNQSIVDQDAAITAYLDGLLRDPEQDEAVPAPRSRKTPGLKVIAPETSESAAVESVEDTVSVDEMTAAVDAEASEADAAARPDESGDIAADDVMPATDESPTDTDDRQETPAEASEDAPAESTSPAVGEETEADEAAAAAMDAEAFSGGMTDAAAVEEDGVARPEVSDEEAMAAMAAEPETLVEDVESSPWAWLRVGGMTLAVPAEAVVSRHADAALDPVPGAPVQVAGALNVEGRPRLILSLASVTGARPRGDAAEVLLLGPAGLWGVVGEPAEAPEAFDADAVQWRSESQKAERRGWLAGTHPAAGVAVLDVAGLRAALKGSR